MPERNAEFSRDGHGRFVSPAPCCYRQSPLLQRIIYLQEFLARLDEQRTMCRRSSVRLSADDLSASVELPQQCLPKCHPFFSGATSVNED